MDFIRQYIETSRSAPTLKEIAQAIGVTSLATVHEHLANLESKGLIKRTGGKNKSITLLDKKYSAETSDGLRVPVLGFIAAGAPIEPFTDPNATIAIHPTFVSGQKRVYVLQVKGESMIDEQIRDGDYVIVNARPTAQNGDMVVALVHGDSATVKKFYREKDGKVRLQPANAAMPAMLFRPEDVLIQGIVVGVIRRY